MASSAISAQGTIIQIATGSGGAKTITAIAAQNPVMITASAHGFSNGDVVAISGVTGADAALLNGLSFVVQFKTTNTFCVAVDGTGKTLTATGTATPTTYTAIANCKDFSGLDGTTSEIIVSNFASTAVEVRTGLIDNGHFTMSIDVDNSDAGQLAADAARIASATKAFKLIFPSGSTPTASFNGFVTKFDRKAAVNQVISGSITVRISGAVTWA